MSIDHARRLISLLLIGASSAACGNADVVPDVSSRQARVLVVRHATVFDTRTATAIPDRAIVMRGGRIEQVVADSALGTIGGAEVIDADKVGHKIYLPDTPAWREIVEAFGDGVLAADRSVDRTRLGPIVFADPQALQTLNRIM